MVEDSDMARSRPMNDETNGTGDTNGTGETNAKKTFSDNAAAVRTSGANIAKISADLRKAQPNDMKDLRDHLDAEVAQLHLAINNAHTQATTTENTGGAADTSAIDPNAHKDT